MEDVKPLMYSDSPPAHVQPAKKRIWSTMGTISSDKVDEYGLPVFSDDTLLRGFRLDCVGEP
jgi:hypothetical protein